MCSPWLMILQCYALCSGTPKAAQIIPHNSLHTPQTPYQTVCGELASGQARPETASRPRISGLHTSQIDRDSWVTLDVDCAVYSVMEWTSTGVAPYGLVFSCRTLSIVPDEAPMSPRVLLLRPVIDITNRLPTCLWTLLPRQFDASLRSIQWQTSPNTGSAPPLAFSRPHIQ